MVEFKEYKRGIIEIARELGYISQFPNAKTRLNSALTVDELSRIMAEYRRHC